MKKWIFWFRQDLRTFDNTWFIKSINDFDEVLPIFIIDKNIVDSFWWLENKKFWFINEALTKLSDEIYKLSWKKLNVFFDYPEKIIPFLVKKYYINWIYTNKSYSRYWTKRDEIIYKYCEENNIIFQKFNDFLLIEPENIPQRKVFTPYFKLWQKQVENWFTLKTPKKFKQLEIEENYNSTDFIKIKNHPYFNLDFWINRLKNNIKINYDEIRNSLDLDWTTKLSPFIRFWIFSIREIFEIWKNNHTFIQELAWREFWQHINYYFPETKNIEFQENKRHIKWEKDIDKLERWKNWETWYPIVDACIKQLLETNRMHWRWRMIVASFLTKDLHIDWREWEDFFKKHLLDYDENMNFWNWQWSASVWADPKPLRIFNPILQSQKFDKNCKFIKKYIPSLKDYEEKTIHDPINYQIKNYFPPIVNHNIEQKIARQLYKRPD